MANLRLIKKTTVHSITIKFDRISAANAEYMTVNGQKFISGGNQLGVSTLVLQGNPSKEDIDKLVEMWNYWSLKLKTGFLIDSPEIVQKYETTEYVRDTTPIDMGRPADSIMDVVSSMEEQIAETAKATRRMNARADEDLWRFSL